MKYLSCLVVLVLFAATCTPKELKDAKVTMSTQTRGYEDRVEVYNSKVTSMKNVVIENAGAQNQVVELTAKELNALLKTARSFDYTKLNEYAAPSNGRATDRAAIRRLVIEYDGKTYESVPFDHNNPPAELKPLVDALSTYIPK